MLIDKLEQEEKDMAKYGEELNNSLKIKFGTTNSKLEKLSKDLQNNIKIILKNAGHTDRQILQILKTHKVLTSTPLSEYLDERDYENEDEEDELDFPALPTLPPSPPLPEPEPAVREPAKQEPTKAISTKPKKTIEATITNDKGILKIDGYTMTELKKSNKRNE